MSAWTIPMATPPFQPPMRLPPAAGARGLAVSLRAVFGWRPIQVLLLAAIIGFAVPVLRARIDPYGMGKVAGGISIDTSGEEGRIAYGRFRLDLPLHVINRSERAVVAVEMWTEAWDCPGRFTPLSGCRRMLSTGQEFPLRLAQGEDIALPTVLAGAAPRDADDGDTVRIVRRISNIYDEHDVKRKAALDVYR
ncbi:MAG: hypothetical protein KGN34_02335 [Sphingomonadales bacterium]|nr:hypothetical protein [Sphingomonadales bacterium]